MDLFSHALFPYLLGSYFKKRREEITAFVIGGIAPDADIFLLWIQYLHPTFFLITHRGITHSIFFGFITGMLVLYVASTDVIKSIVKRKIDFQPVFSKRNIFFCSAGVIIHLLFDYSTTGGIPLFYPFDVKRYSANLFFYTDIFIAIMSLIIVILIFRKPYSFQNIKVYLLAFLIFTGGSGAFRFIEKNNAEKFFNDAAIKVVPAIDPFDWYAIKESSDRINIYEYDGFEKTIIYNNSLQRLNMISGGEGYERAINVSDDINQLKMFKWRARTVALNASFINGTWSLEYYDPLERVQMRDISTSFRSIGSRFGSITINVTGERAVVK